MKRNLKIYLAAFMFINAFSSCVKEKETRQIENDFECALIYLQADTYSYEFSYDNEKRLINATYNNYASTPAIYEATDFYNGKVSKYQASTDGYDYFYETYSWGRNELTIFYYEKDDFDNYFLETKYVFTYDSQGQVIQRDWYRDSGSGLQLVGIRKYTWYNGNITKREYWFPNKKMGIENLPIADSYNSFSKFKSMDETWSYTVTFTYDNKPNAKASLGLFWVDDSFSKNNVTSATYEYADGSFAVSNIAYTYNSDGYPEYSYETYQFGYDPKKYYSTYYYYNCEK